MTDINSIVQMLDDRITEIKDGIENYKDPYKNVTNKQYIVPVRCTPKGREYWNIIAPGVIKELEQLKSNILK